MSLIQDEVIRTLEGSGPLAVVAPEGPEGVFAAAVVALAWAPRRATVLLVKTEGAPAEPRLVAPGGDSWAAAIAEWWAEQSPSVPVMQWDGSPLDRTALDVEQVVAAGTAALLLVDRPRCEQIAVLGAGPEHDGLLAEQVGGGAVSSVEVIPRFGAVGRLFIEMVEHVHHRVGPMAQSTAADVLRASLFGRHGEIPVNLATRETPQRVGPARTLIWWLDPDAVR